MPRRESVHEAFLQNIPLAVIVDNERDMKFININRTLGRSLQKLCEGDDLQALPVYNPKTCKYEYVASRLDIISMVAWTNTKGWMKSPLLDVLETEEHVVDPRIFKFTMNDAVVVCLESFSKGVHHILIENEEYQENKDAELDNDDQDSDRIEEAQYYFISQFDIVAFLYKNLQRMSAIVDAPIDVIGLVKRRNLEKDRKAITTVSHKLLAKEAMKKFLVHRCDVIAIVNETGELVGHVSESDLIGVGPQAINFMLNDKYLSIYDFMIAVNKNKNGNQKGGGKETGIEPVCCFADEKFKNLIRLVVEKKSNHIFIIEEKTREPIKIVSLNDIICKFSPYDYKSNKASKRLSLMSAGSGNQVDDIVKKLSLSDVKEEDDDDDDSFEDTSGTSEV